MISTYLAISAITLLVILFIYIINNSNLDNRIIFIINFLLLSESFAVTFFFGKYSVYSSFTIFLIAAYYLLSSKKFDDFKKYQQEEKYVPVFPSFLVKKFKFIGMSTIFLVFLYEFFADMNISTAGSLLIFFGFLLLIYDLSQRNYHKEIDFLLFFTLISIVIFVLPLATQKILLHEVGEDTKPPYSQDDLVYVFLGVPLYNMLKFAGYSVDVDGPIIYYEDLDSGLFTGVAIAESCSGISSIQVFLILIFSLYYIRFRRLDRSFLFFMFFGIVVSYFANLFRMFIVVLSGHYFGNSTLLLVHEYAGWLIFTGWIFIFVETFQRYSKVTRFNISRF